MLSRILIRSTLALGAVHAALTPAAAEDVRWSFEDAPLDGMPAHWKAAKTGTGPGSVWKVLADDTAPDGRRVLAQTSSEGPNPLYNLCVTDQADYTDLELSVSFKAVSGKLDQGGGVVWRYRDEKNYYIARYNPLEENYRVYKVVDGRRTQLASADVTLPAEKWFTLRITHKGNGIKCYLEDKLHLEAEDATFPGAGKVGLWTKADAVTSFDQFTAKPLSE
jgi:hypothetical protein